jgi:Uma2 family endonuclease
MPAALTERPSPPAVQYPPRKRWTRAECDRLEALGVFDQQHLELIEGELIDKKGKHRPHVNAATLLFGWLIQVFGLRFVNSEAPIDVAPEDNPTSQPEPDLIVLNGNYSEFRSANPQPRDLDLVVEVADTSLQFDLTVKAALYSRAGIVEYWILDVASQRLIVHLDPQDGQYASVIAYGRDESVSPLASPNASFLIRSVFPD